MIVKQIVLKFSEHLTKGEIFVFFVLLKKVKLKTITMKKKVTLLCAVAAMGIAAAAGVSLQNRAQLSDVALANIEALASGEGGIGISSLCAYQRDFWCIYPAVVGEDGTVLDEATRVQGVITTDAGDGAYTVGG